MSAFLCSDLHTCVLAVYAEETYLVADAASAARALRRMNNRAMRHRYGDAPAALRSLAACLQEARKHLQGLSDADVAALANCMAYQCAEGPSHLGQPEWPLVKGIEYAARMRSGGHASQHVWAI